MLIKTGKHFSFPKLHVNYNIFFKNLLPLSHSISNYFQFEDISGQIRENIWNKVLTKRTTDRKMLKLCHPVQDPLCFNTGYKPTTLTLTCTFAEQGCRWKEILQWTCVFWELWGLPYFMYFTLCFHSMWWRSDRRKHECSLLPKAIIVQFCQKICSCILFWYNILFSHNCIL